MSSNDSKTLWLDLEREIRPETMSLGRYTTQAYLDDPCALAFISARYKFCAKLLSSKDRVLEIGCGDGFGGALIAQKVKNLICTDINADLINDNQKRMRRFENIEYCYHDFRESPYQPKVDAAYCIDVIEHIYPAEEEKVLQNIVNSLNAHGVCVIGTPNKTAEQYASPYSREGHVNLKEYDDLIKLGRKHFNNSFIFGMNDEVVHTGFPQMAHFLWLLGVDPRVTTT